METYVQLNRIGLVDAAGVDPEMRDVRGVLLSILAGVQDLGRAVSQLHHALICRDGLRLDMLQQQFA